MVTQLYPTSTTHELSQPSPLLLLPSSHVSPGEITIPSPQIGSQVSAEEVEPPVQDQPVSTTQFESHPSPVAVFESSHASAPILKPSPQIGSHAESGVFVGVVTQL